MKSSKAIKIFQALVGSIILSILLIVPGVIGYGMYIWMLFLPLILFFALGANVKLIPSIILCYMCGVAWAYLSHALQLFLGQYSTSDFVIQTLPNTLLVFLVLVVHDNFLSKTPFGVVPSVFLGMASTFFAFTFAQQINGLHLLAFFCYGLVMTLALVFGSTALSGLVFGKEAAIAAATGGRKE